MEKKKKIMIGVITVIVIILLIVAINIIVTNVLGEEERTNTASVENTRVNGETDNTANVSTSINTGDNQSNENVSTVYFTSDITSEGLLNIYHALGFEPEGNVAIKLSTGEMGGNYYLQPDLIDDLVQEVDGTIVENNTYIPFYIINMIYFCYVEGPLKRYCILCLLRSPWLPSTSP